MFPFDPSSSTFVAVVWLSGALGASFLVSWIAGDVRPVGRTRYIAVLTTLTAAFTAGFVAWSGAGSSFWTHRWGWGIVGGTVTSIVLAFLVRRRLPALPASQHLGRLIGWEGVVYGAAEGLLLSVMPVAMMWQIARSLDWTEGAGAFGSASLALLASIALIVLHHLGYPDFRNSLMRYPVLMCSVLSVAYLLTASPIAPIVGHIVLHVVMLRRGIELPPHVRVETPSKAMPARAA